jgi:hypothetical protein
VLPPDSLTQDEGVLRPDGDDEPEPQAEGCQGGGEEDCSGHASTLESLSAQLQFRFLVHHEQK